MQEPAAILWLGVVGTALAYFYNAPPVRLSYRGLGEAAVALVYGPMIVSGTVLVQRGAVEPGVVAASAALGILIAAFLWVNQFPDYHADRSTGKRNWVVRLGRESAARVFGVLIAAAAAAVALLPAAGLPYWTWLGLSFLLPGSQAVWLLLENPTQTALVVPAQALTLAAFTLMSLSTGCGLLLARWLTAGG
jgi:1,4-dihydroxy-2-naphthoate octaprenyltransferase